MDRPFRHLAIFALFAQTFCGQAFAEPPPREALMGITGCSFKAPMQLMLRALDEHDYEQAAVIAESRLVLGSFPLPEKNPSKADLEKMQNITANLKRAAGQFALAAHYAAMDDGDQSHGTGASLHSVMEACDSCHTLFRDQH